MLDQPRCEEAEFILVRLEPVYECGPGREGGTTACRLRR